MLPALFPVCRAGHAALQAVRTQTGGRAGEPDHPANALISALRETASPTMYVTQLPVASTHPKSMSQKDETRGGADSIRAANYLKRWAILYR